MGERGKKRREGEGRSLNSAWLDCFTGVKRGSVSECVCVGGHSVCICVGERPLKYDDKVSVLCVHCIYCTDHSAS